ncbi:MAG: glycosyltransferase family 2 protein [SAR324 cluster bacterium]|nr:glycosyltransferase family 2 protein [SAR324 cluster bacterium]MBF0351773.1 glycosyltransferase family 2 protein [SAR324 cluster bacterium]
MSEQKWNSASKYQLSVIMPALNEENNIIGAVNDVVRAFEQLNISGEIIVINDGSTDQTPQMVESLKQQHPFIKMITHARPKGIGASYWEGVWTADGEVVVMIPGDGENDTSEIIRYFPLMDHVDIVIPYFYNKEARTQVRQFISKLYKLIINVSFGILLNYMNGTVMYRRSILRGISLRSSGFFYQTELLIKCIKKGYLYAEVPYAINTRPSGESKAIRWSSLRKVIEGYFMMLASTYILNHDTDFIAQDSVTSTRKQALLNSSENSSIN